MPVAPVDVSSSTMARISSEMWSRRLRGGAFDRLVSRPGLFLAVLFGMSLHGLFSMPSDQREILPRAVQHRGALGNPNNAMALGGPLQGHLIGVTTFTNS